MNHHYQSVKITLGQWFSAGDNFASKGHLAVSGDIFDNHDLGLGECYWHSVGRG